jgi:N-acetylglucosaminyl-diphospho-decaprenol L-rhamnosyltransferase
MTPSREQRLAQEAAARDRAQGRLKERKEVFDSGRLVGAVVVTFGDASHVRPLLRRLSRQVAQVVVVDLSSDDGTLDAVRTTLPGVEPIVLPTTAGYGAAVNAGVRALEQPVILAVHGDARPRKDAIERLLEDVAVERRRVGCAGARLISPEGVIEASAGFRPTTRARIGGAVVRSFPEHARYYIRRPARYVPHKRLDVGWVSDATMMFRRHAWEQVGGMDERYFLAYGAMDFCLRLRAGGWRVVHEIRARVIHLDHVEESSASVRAARRRFYADYGAQKHVRRLLRRDRPD